MSMYQYSLDIGKSCNFFYSIKKRSPEMFKLIKKIGNDNLAIGYSKVVDTIAEQEEKIFDIRNQFKNIATFCDWLVSIKAYENQNSARTILNHLFIESDSFSINNYFRNEKIINAWNKADKTKLRGFVGE